MLTLECTFTIRPALIVSTSLSPAPCPLTPLILVPALPSGLPVMRTKAAGVLSEEEG